MLIKIARQKAIDTFPILPVRYYNPKEDEEVFNNPKVFANYVLTLPSKSFKGHQKLLGTQLVNLAKSFGCDKLIFLGDTGIAWLKRLNTHDTFLEALQYLVDKKIGKRFNGALQVDTEELSTFITHLCWLVRTNGILQYVYFTDPAQNFTGNICQYGNLHISTKNNAADTRFKKIISKSQFTFLTGTNCINKFSKKNVIKERGLSV